MAENETSLRFREEEEDEIDLLALIRALWKRVWLIILCTIIGAAAGFFLSAYVIAPSYSSYVNLYVNNIYDKNASSITTSEISAAKSLVSTYGEILLTRTTLERVLEAADVDYTWKELSEMIEYEAVNDVEIMQVTVTGPDPYEACDIANAIAEILPGRVSEIVEGASMKVVDTAVTELKKVAPSEKKYLVIGAAAGMVLCVGILVLLYLLDDTVHDEDYVLQTYGYPILGRIPDLLNAGGKNY